MTSFIYSSRIAYRGAPLDPRGVENFWRTSNSGYNMLIADRASKHWKSRFCIFIFGFYDMASTHQKCSIGPVK